MRDSSRLMVRFKIFNDSKIYKNRIKMKEITAKARVALILREEA